MSQLQNLRFQYGMTQQDIANIARVDVRTVKRWEAESDPPERIKALYRSLSKNNTENEPDVTTQPVSLEHVMSIVPDPLPLTGKLAPLLGSLPQDEQFTILLGGASGAGKSTAGLVLAGDLADHGAVLIATSEERLGSGTIGRRAHHADINPDLIDVAEVSSTDELRQILVEGDYSFVVIDSINELGIEAEEASLLFREFPDTSFVLVAQADATEKRTVGGARWRHICDVRLWCERDEKGRRLIKNLKNRFGPKVDHIILDKTVSSSRSLADTFPTETQPHNSPTMEKNMDNTYRWMIAKLETDLSSAQQEIRDLRDKLAAKDERLREAELELARNEARQQSLDETPKRGLADVFDADKLITLADRFAPLIGLVTSSIMNRGVHNPAPAHVQSVAVHNTNPFDFDPAPQSVGTTP